MFCQKCGSKVNDGAKGSFLTPAASYQSANSGAPDLRQKKKNKVTLIIDRLAAVVAVIVLVVSLSGCNGSSTISSLVEDSSNEIMPGDNSDGSLVEEGTDTKEAPADEDLSSDNMQASSDENPSATAAYAVCIYGIEQDADINGNAMGLTFGPALGEDYSNSYVSHEVDDKGNITGSDAGNTSSGNAYRCIHCDNWETIITWNKEDPYVYEQCLENGCTHSVLLDFGSMESFRNDFVFTGTGDGPSVLCEEFLDRFGETWSSSGYYDIGWAGSRARAVLNGAQPETDTTSTGEDWAVVLMDTADIYTSSNCLLAAFPKELQEAIGERETAYGASYDTNTASYVYDKLFLFSVSELTSDSTLGGIWDADRYYHSYDSLSGNGISSTPYYSKWVTDGLIGKEAGDNNPSTVGYSIEGTTGGSTADSSGWWLRSSFSSYDDCVVAVIEDGSGAACSALAAI